MEIKLKKTRGKTPSNTYCYNFSCLPVLFPKLVKQVWLGCKGTLKLSRTYKKQCSSSSNWFHIKHKWHKLSQYKIGVHSPYPVPTVYSVQCWQGTTLVYSMEHSHLLGHSTQKIYRNMNIILFIHVYLETCSNFDSR